MRVIFFLLAMMVNAFALDLNPLYTAKDVHDTTFVSVTDFGCVSGGVYDNTSCINAAFAKSSPRGAVYLPPGLWKVSDALRCTGRGVLYGAGDWTSIITVETDFNMSAPGVLLPGVMGTTPGCTIKDIGISFRQPDFAGMTIANIIQYPPAINADNLHEITIEGSVRITNAWTCISMLSPLNATGGSQISRVKCSTYSLGLTIDGANAGIHVGSWDEETFSMTANQSPIFISQGNSGAAVAIKIGRCDGCAIDSLLTFTHGLSVVPSVANISGINVAIAQMDGAGANIINSGVTPLRIGTLLGTGFSNGGKIQSSNAGALTVIGSMRLADNATGCDINVSNGLVVIGTGNYVVGTTNLAASNVCLSGGTLQMQNVNFGNTTLHTAPVVLVTGGILNFIGNVTSGIGAGSGSFIEIDTDNSNHFVSGNALNGWGVTLGFTTAAGYYDFGDYAFPVTATPQFATMGDFAPTGLSSGGFIYRRGNFVDLYLSSTFSTNAYTTAAGQFSLGISGPAAVSSNQACPIGFMNNVVTSGNQVTAFTNSGSVVFSRTISGGTTQNFGPAQVPPSIAAINFHLSCRYRVR